jgi:hypothetical protein
MPWWLQASLDWFPALIIGLGISFWLDLPLGATLLTILIIAGISRVTTKLWQRARGGKVVVGK